jgi:alkylation response protein AidB-like acyl-CoA dehydrogenase
LTRAWIDLDVLRVHALRTQATDASVTKLLWSRWHREFGELAMAVLGAPSMVARGAPYDLDEWQRLFLFSRADTIYGGSDEIQRTIIAERVLGLPRRAVSEAGRRDVWTEERSDEGRRRIEAPRRANQEVPSS